MLHGFAVNRRGARPQEDARAAAWIAGRLLPWGRDDGTRVGAIAPTGFPAYVRVFHAVDEAAGGRRIRRRWQEIAARTGHRMHPAVQFSRFGWDHPPGVGTLGRPEAAALVGVLRNQGTAPEDCWMALWNGYAGRGAAVTFRSATSGSPAEPPRPEPPPGTAAPAAFSLPGRTYHLYRGPIDAVLGFDGPAGLPPQTPNLWWPDDRDWFVATEVDFDSTIVACDRRCAEALLASGLEALEVSSELRLDLDGDRVNPRSEADG